MQASQHKKEIACVDTSDLNPEEKDIANQYHELMEKKLDGTWNQDNDDAGQELILKDMISKNQKLVEIAKRMEQSMFFQK